MKKILKRVSIIVLTALAITMMWLVSERNRLIRSLDVARNNEKALILEKEGLEGKSIEYRISVEQLSYYKDSLLEVLDRTRRELGIKDKELERMQYMASLMERSDTVVFRDTVFVEGTSVDTLIGDKWYSLELKLEYPSSIMARPSFRSEKMVFMSLRKQTVDPPKKCWLGRLFQKKHKVMEVEVVEKNPYMEAKEQRFVEIVK